jgi:hypothetical protein
MGMHTPRIVRLVQLPICGSLGVTVLIAAAPRALEPPREIRLEPGQLAELAEILRRHQRLDQ